MKEKPMVGIVVILAAVAVFMLDVAFREGGRVLGEFDALIEQQRAQRAHEHAQRDESQSSSERRPG